MHFCFTWDGQGPWDGGEGPKMNSLALQVVRVDCYLEAQLGPSAGCLILLRVILFTQLLGLPPSRWPSPRVRVEGGGCQSRTLKAHITSAVFYQLTHFYCGRKPQKGLTVEKCDLLWVGEGMSPRSLTTPKTFHELALLYPIW